MWLRLVGAAIHIDTNLPGAGGIDNREIDLHGKGRAGWSGGRRHGVAIDRCGRVIGPYNPIFPIKKRDVHCMFPGPLHNPRAADRCTCRARFDLLAKVDRIEIGLVEGLDESLDANHVTDQITSGAIYALGQPATEFGTPTDHASIEDLIHEDANGLTTERDTRIAQLELTLLGLEVCPRMLHVFRWARGGWVWRRRFMCSDGGEGGAADVRTRED